MRTSVDGWVYALTSAPLASGSWSVALARSLVSGLVLHWHDLYGFQTRGSSDVTSLENGQSRKALYAPVPSCIPYFLCIFFICPQVFVELVLDQSTTFHLICERWKVIKITLLLCELKLVAKWKKIEKVVDVYNSWSNCDTFADFFFARLFSHMGFHCTASWTRLFSTFILTLFCLFKDLHYVNSSWRSNFELLVTRWSEAR